MDEEWWSMLVYRIYNLLRDYEVVAELTGAHGTAWTFRLRRRV